METTVVSAVTEVLFNILLGCVSIAILTWGIVAVQSLFSEIKRGRREQEAAKRDEEYHKERMKELRK